MSLRQVHKFEFTCDGYRPDGRVCGLRFETERYGMREAEVYARNRGWTQDHRGWICDHPVGHRGDRNIQEGPQ